MLLLFSFFVFVETSRNDEVRDYSNENIKSSKLKVTL